MGLFFSLEWWWPSVVMPALVVEHSDNFVWTTVRLVIEGQPEVRVSRRFDPEVAAVLTR